MILANQGQKDEALNYYRQALAINEQLGDLTGKTTNLTNIGLIFYDQGQLNESLEYLQQALAIAEQLEDISMVTDLKNIISSLGK